jgi:hypothetical protein
VAVARPQRTFLYDLDRIKTDLTDRIASLAKDCLPHGRLEAGSWRAAGWNAGEWKRDTVSVVLHGPSKGGWQDWLDAEGRGHGPLDLIMRSKGLSTSDAIAWAAHWLGYPEADAVGTRKPEPTRAPDPPDAEAEKAAADMFRWAQKLWEVAHEDLAGPVDSYHFARGINIPPPPCVRYLPQHLFKPTETKCPVVLIRVDSVAGEMVGVHRIYLDPETPHKKLTPPADDRGVRPQVKRSVADTSVGAIHLTPADGETLNLTEGYENGMSVLEYLSADGDPVCVWALTGTSSLKKFVPPRQVKRLILWGDYDKAVQDPKNKMFGKRPGVVAAQRLAEHLRASRPDIEFLVVFPPVEGEDWNDVARFKPLARDEIFGKALAAATIPIIPVAAPPADPEPMPIEAKVGPMLVEAPASAFGSEPGGDWREERRRRRGHNDGVGDLEVFQDMYVYARAPDAFIDMLGNMWSEKQINNSYAHLPGMKKLGALLMAHTDTTKTVGVCYWPGQKRIVEDRGLECWNLWRPGELQPAKGDVSLFTHHVRNLVDDDPVAFRYFIDYLAAVVQKPGVKIMSAPLIITKQGSGKSRIVKIMKAILGEYNVKAVMPEDLQDKFNDWAMNVQLLVVEELMVQDRADTMNKLKPLITNEEIRINAKNRQAFHMTNRFNMAFFSNHEDAAILEKSDRRYMVHISQAPVLEPSWFEAYDSWLEKGGCAAVYDYLLNEVDLTSWSPFERPPMTGSKELLIRLSSGESDFQLDTMLDEQRPPFDVDLVAVSDIVKATAAQGQKVSARRATIWLRKIGALELGKSQDGHKGAAAHILGDPARRDLEGREPRRALGALPLGRDGGRGRRRAGVVGRAALTRADTRVVRRIPEPGTPSNRAAARDAWACGIRSAQASAYRAASPATRSRRH